MGSSSRGGESMNHGDLCLTMHQPWASLLVHGIKRIEGRSWPAPLRGRLWIHSAGKVPDRDTIKAMEDFYKEIYAVDGITDLKFPEHYPASRLLGCVDVVGSVKCEELVSWEEVPQGVRLEALTDFCWLCENPKKLSVPFEMRGFKGVYNLEQRIHEAAVRSLASVESPSPTKFPLPLKPRSLDSSFSSLKISDIEQSPSLVAAIAGARAAATQYSKQPKKPATGAIQQRRDMSTFRETSQPRNYTNDYGRPRAGAPNGRPHNGNVEQNYYRENRQMVPEPNFRNRIQPPRRDMNHQSKYRYPEDNAENGKQEPIHDGRRHYANFSQKHDPMSSGGHIHSSTQPTRNEMNNEANNRSTKDYRRPVGFLDTRPQYGNSAQNYREKNEQIRFDTNSGSQSQGPHRDSTRYSWAPKRQ